MDEYRPDFNEGTFANLVLYLAARGEKDPAFGKTKLWKSIWLSDFLAYARLGSSITGADYVHMPQGPGPTRGDRMLRSLERDGALAMPSEPYYRQTIQRPVAISAADPVEKWLSPEQLQIVEEVLEHFAGANATDTSEWAHEQSVGWLLTENGQRIPYETVFLSPETPTEEDLEWAREMVSRRSA